MKRALTALDRWLFLTLSSTVAFILISMVLLAFLQVILRNFFGTGIGWADVILRHLVLWVCMLGGVLATHEARHIGIDLVPRLVGKKGKAIVSILGSVFVAVVSVLLARASWVFVASEKEFGTRLFGEFPAWIAQVIIPAGFILIAFQVLLNLSLARFGDGVYGQPDEQNAVEESEPDSATNDLEDEKRTDAAGLDEDAAGAEGEDKV